MKLSMQLAAAVGRAMVLIVVLFSSTGVFASNVAVITKLDTNQILIGDQVRLSLEVIRDEATAIAWPDISTTIKIDSTRELEILATQLDTFDQPSGMVKETKTYTITAFDSGYYVIPPLPFKYKDPNSGFFQDVVSEAMLLTVIGIEVDTTADFKPLKEPLTMPFQLREILVELLIAGGLFILLAGAIYYFSLRKKKPALLRKFVRKEPAHETALNKLRVLDEKKLWQQGDVKPYYSELSDIVREYLEKRYGFPALESTTDEIMERIVVTGISHKLREDLQMMLQTADLVKFAKAMPLADEHKKYMDNSVAFVQTTKTDEQVQNIEVTEKQP